jgi:hypothetical protein
MCESAFNQHSRVTARVASEWLYTIILVPKHLPYLEYEHIVYRNEITFVKIKFCALC